MKKPPGKSRGPPDPDLAAKIGSTVRAAREAAKLTQSDVAERVGLQSEVYGRLERGKMLPSVPTLVGLAVVLGISSDVMLGLAGELVEVGGKAFDDGLSPELRRLLRSVRKLEPEQLKVFTLMTNALLKIGQKREEDPTVDGQEDEEEDEHSKRLGI